MKRVIIVCEGQTEQAFCNDVLQSHFNQCGIYLQSPTIKKTAGGIVSWAALKYQVEKHLLEDKDAIVTTLIDYYGIYAHHEYPKWEEAKRKINRAERMDILENEMLMDISEDLQTRFIPYIQLHEFEGLLFSDLWVFDNNFEDDEFLDYDYLIQTIRDNPNPELINDGNETAPSKRLSRIIRGYDKVIYGALFAYDIGLAKIRSKCPRFNDWITKIENI